ncbi:MAG: hypothetical protein HY236_08830 [Acidobacteria bacterium]|nr:hypothetical protein [Acidobacteriota bacterium]
MLACASPSLAGEKLTFAERTEIVLGLMAEYATVKVALPRSKKALEVTAAGKHDKEKWAEAMQQNGPAGRVGDLVQITKVGIEGDRLLFEINYGMKGRRRWWHNVEVGTSTSGRMAPIAQDQNSNAPSGTMLALVFDKQLPPLKAAEIKKMLQPILDFEKHSATELYTDTLPKEFQEAIKAKKVLVGMDREMVLLAKGRPENKLRETKDGVETEDWIFGKPPGTITFVTFEGDKVIRVKDMYAGAQ